MAELWFYTNEGKQMDGVSMKELKRLVGDGVLKPTDMVWKEGMPRWIRASSIKELFPDPASDLDRFFTNTGETTKKDPAPASPVTAGKSSSAPTPTSKKSESRDPDPEPEPEPRERKRRRSSSDDDTGRRPRSESGGGASNIGIIIALVLGGGVLLLGLAVGVIILIFAFQPVANVPNNPRDGEGKIEEVKIVPGQDPPPFTLTLQPRGQGARMVSLRQGATYQITVRSQWQGPGRPDVDLFVLNRFGALQGSDTSIGPDSNLTFVAREDGDHRIELRNLDGFIRAQSTVTIRLTKDAPNVKKDKPDVQEPPLPPGVLEGANVKDTATKILRNQTHEMRFRVKGGHAARITATVQDPLVNPGIIVSVARENGTLIVTPTGAARSTTVNFNVPATEIVILRIRNISQRSTRCTVSYNVSP